MMSFSFSVFSMISMAGMDYETMFKNNVGRIDRIIRLIVGGILAMVGLFPLGGWQGHSAGVDLALFALWPLATGLFGFCGIYLFFGISTMEKNKPLDNLNGRNMLVQ